MGPVQTIALSGMTAATRRLQASASNIANAQTTGALPGVAGPAVYTPVDVQLSAQAGGGVTASLAPSAREARLAYDPKARFADARGYVAAPDVDMVGEIVGLAMASYAFAANLKVLRTADDMARTALKIAV
jgi:flagellar basal-body rod protein FlgC